MGSPTAAVAAGNTFALTDTTANKGTRTAGTSKTAYLLSADTKRGKDDVPLGKRNVNTLRARAKETVTKKLTVPPSTMPGPYYLLACADASKDVRETVESNNCRASSPVHIDPAPTSFDLIEGALAVGNLDPETGLIYKVFAAFGDRRLPRKFEGAPPVELDGGAHVLVEVSETWSSLSPESKMTLLPFITPPAYEGSWAAADTSATKALATTTQASSNCSPDGGPTPPINENWTYIDTARARIWYSKVDWETASAAKSQSVAGWIAAEIETGWEDISGLLGRQPPSDLSEVCNGGDGRLDIYVMPVAHLIAVAVPFPPGEKQRPSFVVVDPAKIESAKVARDVAAHEFTHVLQHGSYAYLGEREEYRWLDEATATYMIDYVYPEDQYEHRFAEEYLTSCCYFTKPLESEALSSDLGGYEDYLYLLYLARQYGAGVIRHISDNVEIGDSLEAIEHGVPGGWKQTWPEFALQAWNRPGARFFSDEDSLPYGLREGEPDPFTQTSPMLIRVALGEKSRKEFDLGDPQFGADPPYTKMRTVSRRAINYTHFEITDEKVRALRLEDFGFQEPGGSGHAWSLGDPAFEKVQALLTLANGDTRVEDWTNKRSVELCRDRPEENVTNVLVLYTYTKMTSTPNVGEVASFPRADEAGRVLGKAVATKQCEFPKRWTGSASGTVTGPDGQQETFDATITLERYYQGSSGAEYELADAQVNWSYSGGGCSTSKSYGKDRVTAIGMSINTFGDPEVPDEYNLDLRLGGEPVTFVCDGRDHTIYTLNLPGDITGSAPWTPSSTHLSGQETHESGWYPNWTVEWQWDLNAG